MSKDIVIFSASESFTLVSNRLLEKYNLLDILEIIEVTGKSVIDIAKKCINNGTKVFIARGKNVSNLRKNIQIPVVNVQYIFEDFYYSIESTGYKQEEIVMVGFDELYDSLVSFNNLTKYNVKTIHPSSVKAIESDIRNNISKSTKAVIGGLTVKKAAEKLELEYFPYHVQETSIYTAIKNAINILESQKKKDQFSRTIYTTINSISDSVINFDKNLNTVFINNLAEKMIHSIDINILKDIINNMKKKKLNQFEIIKNLNNIDYSIKIKPIIFKNQIENYIMVLNSVNAIQEEEKQIRIKLSSRGHLAKNNFNDIIGNSISMNKTKHIAEKYAKSDNAVLIYGETGTGKELFAQSIHNASYRKNEPFIAINCAVLPENLLESELFGYVKGAFTGASSEGKEGIFESAHGGTVFLDEIGEIDISIQAKLLRVLQEKEISRVGDNRIIPVNVRIISATNKNLLKLVEEKKFREDLYYRLGVLKLDLPNLSMRIEDIPELINNYLKDKYPSVTFTKKLINLLSNHNYPGNVRQLFNIIERLIVLSDSDIITETDFKMIIEPYSEIEENRKIGNLDVFNNKNEKALLISILEKNNGNRNQTAKDLGISTTTLWRKMRKYNITNL